MASKSFTVNGDSHCRPCSHLHCVELRIQFVSVLSDQYIVFVIFITNYTWRSSRISYGTQKRSPLRDLKGMLVVQRYVGFVKGMLVLEVDRGPRRTLPII